MCGHLVREKQPRELLGSFLDSQSGQASLKNFSSPQIEVEGQVLEPRSLIPHWGSRGRLVSVPSRPPCLHTEYIYNQIPKSVKANVVTSAITNMIFFHRSLIYLFIREGTYGIWYSVGEVSVWKLGLPFPHPHGGSWDNLMVPGPKCHPCRRVPSSKLSRWAMSTVIT